MEKIAVVYWSGTRNIEILAKEIANEIVSAGGEVEIFNVSKLDYSQLNGINKFAFRCSSMGNEVLYWTNVNIVDRKKLD